MNDNPHVGDKGEFWFAGKLPSNWFWQPPRRDFGKDGIVVIRDGTDLHNLEFAVQVKTTRQPRVRNGHVIKSGIQRSSIAYWFANPVPTLVVAVDIEVQCGWYEWHMDLFDSPQTLPRGRSNTITVQISLSNKIDDQGWADIRTRLRRFYSGLQRAVTIADASYRLTPALRALIVGVRNLATVAHLPDASAHPHPDLLPALAIHEQVQHRDILVAVRSLLPALATASEPKRQVEAWIEAYEATALLAYPLLRDLPAGDTFGPDVIVAMTPEILQEIRAKLMTAGLDMILSLMSGRAPVSQALEHVSSAKAD